MQTTYTINKELPTAALLIIIAAACAALAKKTLRTLFAVAMSVVRWMLQEHTIKTEGDLGDIRAKGWQYVVYFIAFEVAIFFMCAQW